MHKEYYIWIEIQANKNSICDAGIFRVQMQNCAKAGIGSVILSVKDTSGFVLYPSQYAPHYAQYDKTFKAGTDYLAQCLSIIRNEGMRCFAAVDVFAEGNRTHPHPSMPGLRHPNWQTHVYGINAQGLPQVQPAGCASPLQTSGSIDDFGEIFVNPANAEVCEYELALIRELTRQYDIDGIVLDRARYVGLSSDFSAETRQKWEAFAGKSSEGWPASVYTLVPNKDAEPTICPGEDFGSFLTFRAQTICEYIEKVRMCVDSCGKKMIFLDYTGSWYPLYYQVGANWASQKYLPEEYPWVDAGQYQKTAYAELLDGLLSGFYYPDVLEQEALSHGQPAYWYSVEGAARLAAKVTMGAVPVYGSLFLEQYRNDPAALTQAVHACFARSAGCMLFDLSYLAENNWWPLVGIKAEGLPTFTPLLESDLPQLETLWAQCFPPAFAMQQNDLRQRIFADPALCPQASLALKLPGGKLVGAVVGKQMPPESGACASSACISTLLVHPAFTGHGFGTQLFIACEKALAALGAKTIFIGQEFHNFFSGIPAPTPQKLKFFEQLGCIIHTEDHFDLEADIQNNPYIDAFSPSDWEGKYQAQALHTPEEKEALFAFLSREFPGRWEWEARQQLAQPNQERYFLLLKNAAGLVQGYCHVSASPDGSGGLGPVGIAKELRGQHLGDFLLAASLQHLRRLGVQKVCIDWTILQKFYGQFGFQVVRTYRGAKKQVKEK